MEISQDKFRTKLVKIFTKSIWKENFKDIRFDYEKYFSTMDAEEFLIEMLSLRIISKYKRMFKEKLDNVRKKMPLVIPTKKASVLDSSAEMATSVLVLPAEMATSVLDSSAEMQLHSTPAALAVD
jgi:hypothetical protein